MAGDWSWQNVGVCGEPAGEDPGSARVAWFLEWTDREGRCRRLLYGYGPGARCSAQAAADRIAGVVPAPCVVVTVDFATGRATAVLDPVTGGGA
jgi:hypothetical protein